MKLEYNDTVKNFVKFWNKERLNNPNTWISRQDFINNKGIYIRSFDKYIQRLSINGIDHTPCMGLNVTEFKNAIEQALNY